MKVLMVCLGNICRSPLAEGILKHKAQLQNLDWQIDSAGTGAWHAGEAPDPRSVAVARQNGIDISQQRARQIQPEDLGTYDLIFAMDSSNYRNIRALTPEETLKDKVELIMNLVQPGYNQNVPDPYYDNNGFENVFEMLDRASDKILTRYAVGE